MKKTFFIAFCAIFSAIAAPASALTLHLDEKTEAQDSTLDVIGWFSKRDTVEYWINESQWKFHENDTVKTSDISTKVRLVVTDSTANGYKMDYTFLEFTGDSLGNSFQSNLQNSLIRKLGQKIVGTTVHFETNEYGMITNFTNLEEIREQSESLYKATVKELAEMPVMKMLKEETGFDISKITEKVSTDELVESYIKELKLLFTCHGLSFNLGESYAHKDATDGEYENDTYSNITCDNENGTYEIYSEVVNFIPKENLKEIVQAVVGELVNEQITDSLNEAYDSGMRANATVTSYYIADYIYSGWPYKVVEQTTTDIGNDGKIALTYIYMDYISVENY